MDLVRRFRSLPPLARVIARVVWNGLAAVGLVVTVFLLWFFLLYGRGCGGEMPTARDETSSDSLMAPQVEYYGAPSASLEPPYNPAPPPLHAPKPPPRAPVAGPPEPRPSDDLTGEAILTAVDASLSALMQAQIAFNAPTVVNLGDAVPIDLYLSLSKSAADLDSMLTGPGVRLVESVRVSSIMRAELTGANFKITPVKPAEQVLASEDTHWKWEVTPQSSGMQNLHLSLTAIIGVNGKDRQRGIRTYDKQVSVRVSPGRAFTGFVRQYWQWVFATLLIPAHGWFKRRRARARNGPADLRDEV